MVVFLFNSKPRINEALQRWLMIYCAHMHSVYEIA